MTNTSVRAMVFPIISAAMTILCALAVAVQVNEPDPGRWMMIYGVAGVLSAWVVARGAAPLLPAVIVGLVALVMALAVGRGVVGRVAFSEMFQSWEMESSTIEAAREATGLLIVAAWMTVLSVQAWLVRRR